VTRLFDTIGAESAVAVSRLADEDVYSSIDTSGIELIEVPHTAGVPLVATITADVVRVRHWPNLSGYLESGDDDDIVVWWPSLAHAPDIGRVVTAGPEQAHDTGDRTVFLDRLFKRLEQNPGVSRVCTPRAARGIVYTPGLESSHVALAARRFPGAIRETPERLSEFPGGVCLSITPEVWGQQDAFSETVSELIAEACRYPSATMAGRR